MVSEVTTSGDHIVWYTGYCQTNSHAFPLCESQAMSIREDQESRRVRSPISIFNVIVYKKLYNS